MHYRSEQFAKLRYNVYNLPQSKNVKDEWPELANVPFYNQPNRSVVEGEGEKQKVKTIKPYEGLDVDKLLRYIFVLYDRNTPLFEIDNISERMAEAAIIAGFEKGRDGNFHKSVYQLFRGKNREANLAIIYFCRTQNSSKWTLLVTLEIKHYNDQENILANNVDALPAKVLAEDAERLDQMKSEILSKLNNQSLDESLEEYMLQELGLRPEEVAENLMKGERVTSLEPYKK